MITLADITNPTPRSLRSYKRYMMLFVGPGIIQSDSAFRADYQAKFDRAVWKDGLPQRYISVAVTNRGEEGPEGTYDEGTIQIPYRSGIDRQKEHPCQVAFRTYPDIRRALADIPQDVPVTGTVQGILMAIQHLVHTGDWIRVWTITGHRREAFRDVLSDLVFGCESEPDSKRLVQWVASGEAALQRLANGSLPEWAIEKVARTHQRTETGFKTLLTRGSLDRLAIRQSLSRGSDGRWGGIVPYWTAERLEKRLSWIGLSMGCLRRWPLRQPLWRGDTHRSALYRVSDGSTVYEELVGDYRDDIPRLVLKQASLEVAAAVSL